jgi:lipid-binding SYLF domain-containing protein
MRPNTNHARALWSALLLTLSVTHVTFAESPSQTHERLQKSIQVLRELTSAPDDAIPEFVLKRAEAIVVVPSLIKGGFIVGAEHGNGVMSLRDPDNNTWSSPAFVSLSGGSFGAQIGVQSVDLVLLVVNRDGIDELLKDKFTLGANLSVAAGPVGRSAKAATDVLLSAQILAYSRTKGIFAGVTLDGSTLGPDRDSNEQFYGQRYATKEIVTPEATAPRRQSAIARQWQDTLMMLAGSRASR